jgi:hypothetical protein
MSWYEDRDERELRYARKIDLNAIGSLNKSGLIC